MSSTFELGYPLNTLNYHLVLLLHLGDEAIAGILDVVFNEQLREHKRRNKGKILAKV